MHTRNWILAIAEMFALVFVVAGCAKQVKPQVVPSEALRTEIIPTALKDPTGTPTAEFQMTEIAPHVSPYIPVIVEDVELRFLDTDPVQVELVIRGTLPDQCRYDFYSVENRSPQDVRISLFGIHPADTGCAKTAQMIEYVLPLGRDMPETERGFLPGDYTLTVNNYQTNFSIK